MRYCHFGVSPGNYSDSGQLQFTSSGHMRLPVKIVKHVSDAAGVPVSVNSDKSC